MQIAFAIITARICHKNTQKMFEFWVFFTFHDDLRLFCMERAREYYIAPIGLFCQRLKSDRGFRYNQNKQKREEGRFTNDSDCGCDILF